MSSETKTNTTRDEMKRLSLALVGGIVIPRCSVFVSSDNEEVLLLPVSWRSYVYYHFYPLP